MQFISDFMANLLARVQGMRDDEHGQTLVEYGLIVALISIVCIVALTLVGTEVEAVFNEIGGVLGGATGP